MSAPTHTSPPASVLAWGPGTTEIGLAGTGPSSAITPSATMWPGRPAAAWS